MDEETIVKLEELKGREHRLYSEVARNRSWENQVNLAEVIYEKMQVLDDYFQINKTMMGAQ